MLDVQKREGEAARDELRQERNSMRRTQQNHMQHMMAAAADMRTLQVCSQPSMLISGELSFQLWWQECKFSNTCNRVGPPCSTAQAILYNIRDDCCDVLLVRECMA